MSPAPRPRDVVLALAGERWLVSGEGTRLFDPVRYAAHLAAEGAAPTEVRVTVAVRGGVDGPFAASPPRVEGSPSGLRGKGELYAFSSDARAANVDASVSERPAALEALLSSLAAVRALLGGGLLLHAALARQAAGAALLLAPPGGGKSTAARLLGPRALCANAVVLRRDATRGWLAHPTPFTGKDDPPPRERGPLPLCGAFVLRWGPPACSAPLGGARAATALGRAAFVPSSALVSPGALLERVAELAAQLPVCVLSFREDAIVLPP